MDVILIMIMEIEQWYGAKEWFIAYAISKDMDVHIFIQRSDDNGYRY